MKTTPVLRKSTFLLALAILLAASFLAGSVSGRGQPVNAQDVDSATSPPPYRPHPCNITLVGVDNQSISVQCYDSSTGDQFCFGYPTTTAAEARQANRYLSIIISAKAQDKILWINWDPNPALCSPPNNCCRITSLQWGA